LNRHYTIYLLFCAFLLVFSAGASAQDLDPRAYARVPIDGTVVVTGLGYTFGGVVTDPTSPVQDMDADVETTTLGVGRTFGLFGLTSQAFVALPYSWAQVSGKVVGEEQSITRSGLGDMRIRVSTLLLGAPALSVTEFAKYTSQTVLGVSLTVVAPTGQFYPEKLINLGTNRWSFKPEIGVSYKVTEQWLIDLYAAIWLFTDNNSFYPGTSHRSQNPLSALQGHVSYNFTPAMWAAFDFTYYTGGQSSVNDIYNDDRQDNSRVGATLNIPLSKGSSIKLAYSTGAIIRIGANFSTVSLSWQTMFF